MRKTFEAFGLTWAIVWQEDDAMPPDYEHVDEAWLRMYGEPLNTKATPPADFIDLGDCEMHRFGKRLAITSWPGNSEIAELREEDAGVAQSAEQPSRKRQVVGSIPTSGFQPLTADEEKRLREEHGLGEEPGTRQTAHPEWGDVDRLWASLDEARAVAREAVRLERVLTCAFCGEEYPPGTPASQHERLTAHVKVCAKHPLRAEIERVRALIHRDQTGLAAGLASVRDTMQGWLWLGVPEEWGCYEYQDRTVATLRREINECMERCRDIAHQALCDSGRRAYLAFHPEEPVLPFVPEDDFVSRYALAAWKAEELFKCATEGARLGLEQAAEFDKFWSAIGCLGEEITVEMAIRKVQAWVQELAPLQTGGGSRVQELGTEVEQLRALVTQLNAKLDTTRSERCANCGTTVAPAAVMLLDELQWSGVSGSFDCDPGDGCPSCQASPPRPQDLGDGLTTCGHAADCKLAALLVANGREVVYRKRDPQ